MDYKILLTILGILLTCYGYYHYIKDIFLGKTKPHIFTWFAFGLLSGIIFFAQLFDNGGWGTWITGFTSFVCLFIAFLSIKKGEKDITFTDKLSFLGALIAIGIWYITKDPFYSVWLIIVIDIFSFYPTLRKTYFKPHEETLSQYVMASVKFIFGIAALDNLTFVTYGFPLFLIIANGLFAIMIIVRRKQLGKLKT